VTAAVVGRCPASVALRDAGLRRVKVSLDALDDAPSGP
jgi:molybdenum cofactor biosynthesis enzyme MoaA